MVINLALHDDPRYSLPDEAGVVRGLGLDYVHIPVRFEAPTTEDLLRFFRAMEAHAHRRLWLHCAANLRVSAFLGLYRHLHDGWPRERAFALMDELWQPDPVWARFIARHLADGGGGIAHRPLHLRPTNPRVTHAQHPPPEPDDPCACAGEKTRARDRRRCPDLSAPSPGLNSTHVDSRSP